MDVQAIRDRILEAVREFYHANWPAHAFVRGETRVPYAARVFDADELVHLVDAALDFWLTAGPVAVEMERRLGEFLDGSNVGLCNSGSSANLLALSALKSPKLGDRKLRPGDEVITVAAAFPTTVAPIVQNGLVPVFVDVQLETANIDVAALEEAVSDRTRAISIAHTLGNPFDLDVVQAFARAHGFWLVEDNCDALGSTYHDRPTGTFGDIATLSFYPAHHITTGEGGAVVTRDEQLRRILVSLRDWGRDCWCPPGCDNSCGKRFGWQFPGLPFGYDHKFVYSHLGYNLKITDLQAAIGVAQMEKLPAFIEARRRNHAFLRNALSRYSDCLGAQEATPCSDPSWFGYLILLRQGAGFGRQELAEYLEKAGIATRTLFAGNILRQPAFRDVQYRVVGELANTNRLMENALWVGVYPGLTEVMLAYVSETIGGFLEHKARRRL